jgi:hypothetical protein
MRNYKTVYMIISLNFGMMSISNLEYVYILIYSDNYYYSDLNKIIIIHIYKKKLRLAQ